MAHAVLFPLVQNLLPLVQNLLPHGLPAPPPHPVPLFPLAQSLFPLAQSLCPLAQSLLHLAQSLFPLAQSRLFLLKPPAPICPVHLLPFAKTACSPWPSPPASPYISLSDPWALSSSFPLFSSP